MFWTRFVLSKYAGLFLDEIRTPIGEWFWSINCSKIEKVLDRNTKRVQASTVYSDFPSIIVNQRGVLVQKSFRKRPCI